jgi:xanthine dehydrogenase YagS FAD-binding subunit
MKPFAYASPRSLADAVALLAAEAMLDGGARPLAGGTDLLPLLKADLAAPERLVDIKRLADLDDRIEDGPDGLTIGALATLAEIEDDPLVRAVAPALADAAGLAATPQLRNMATLGGNLLQRPRCWYFRNPRIACWLKGGPDCPARPGENQLHALFDVSPCVAVHPSDPAVALLALDAAVQIRGANGTREMPLTEFFAAPTADRRTETLLGPDELIVSIRIPPSAEPRRSVYRKAMERNVWAFALVGVAVAVRMEGDRIADCRLALGGVAPIPWRAESAERRLTGAAATAATIADAADAALAGATPLAHNGYKLPLARALIRRALTEITTPAPA